MDTTHYSPLQLQNQHSFLLDCQYLGHTTCGAPAFDPTSDPGYSSMSPTSSVDSFCFSPSSQEVLDQLLFCSPAAQCPGTKAPSCSSTKRRSRSRFPGKKRETASEREKLRMRDLTKALHQLRSFLPASLVPAAQTLTKIETLRHTIHYISHLSAQLGLSDEVLERRRSGGVEEVPQTLHQFLEQPSEVRLVSAPQVQNLSTRSLPQVQNLSTRSLPQVQNLSTRSLPQVQNLSTRSPPQVQNFSTRSLPQVQNLSTRSLPQVQNLSTRSLPQAQNLSTRSPPQVQNFSTRSLPQVQNLSTRSPPQVQNFSTRSPPQVQNLSDFWSPQQQFSGH